MSLVKELSFLFTAVLTVGYLTFCCDAVSDCRYNPGSPFTPLAPLDSLFLTPCTGPAGEKGGCMAAAQCNSAYSGTAVRSTVCSAATVCCAIRKCETKFDKLSGYCMPASECSGGTFFDACPGSGRCCVPETTSITCPVSPPLSYDAFINIYSGMTQRRAIATWPYFNTALQAIKGNTCAIVSAFAAQVYVETGGLLKTEESNKVDYENGRWRGRGALQLTGKLQYTAAAAVIGSDVTSHPDRVALPYLGFKAAAWYWNTRITGGLNKYASGTLVGFHELTRLINGPGMNGLSERVDQWNKALSITRCAPSVLGKGDPCDGGKGFCTVDSYCNPSEVKKRGLCNNYAAKTIICCSRK